MAEGTAEELGFFLLDRHLDPMAAIATELGDDLVNVTPPLPGANSAYQLVFHSCGMLEWWLAEAVLGRDVGRNRPAEFVACGTVAQLLDRVARVRAQAVADLAGLDLGAALRTDRSGYTGTPIAASARGALLHALEELAQHHGHLELTRDLLLAGASGAPA